MPAESVAIDPGNESMKRVVVATGESELFAAALTVLSLPQQVEKADGLAVLPGQRESERVIEAITYWQQLTKPKARYLLIAGQNEKERMYGDLDPDRLSQPQFNLVRTAGLVVETRASNTKVQTDWIAHQVQEKGITSLAIFTSLYHLLRVYLTLIQSLATLEIVIPIFPNPTGLGLHCVSPDTGVAMWDLIPGEVQRIKEYTEKGDIATFLDLQQYLLWLHEISL